MNQLLLKQTAILSVILGGIFGVLTLIPFINGIAFLILILCISAVIIVYMKKNDLIGIINVKEGAVLGAVIGFVSFVSFSIVFVPLIAIVAFLGNALFHVTYYTYGITTLLRVSGFFVLIMLVVFLGLLSALMNAFAGLATAYVYELLSGVKKEENENIDIEIK